MSKALSSVIAEFSAQDQRYIARKAKRLAEDMISHADSLADVRAAMAMTQDEVARLLNVKQNAVAQLEKRSDLLISTLRKYVEAMGGELALAVRTGHGAVIMLDSLSSVTPNKPKRRSPPGAQTAQRAPQATRKPKGKAVAAGS